MFSQITELPETTRIRRARLVPLGSVNVSPVEITSPRVVLGSSSDCDISLRFDGVASHHCSLTWQIDAWRLRAHSPMTWLNDGPVKEAAMRHGDCLTLGPVQFRFDLTVDVVAEGPDARNSRSESVLDDEPVSSVASHHSWSPTTSPASQSEPFAPTEDNSQVLKSLDTVAGLLSEAIHPLQQRVTEVGLTPSEVSPTGDASCVASCDSSESMAENSEPAPSAEPMDERAAPSHKILSDADGVHERQLLSERRRLLDEREAELNELFASVNSRHARLLQQQQQLDVLLRRPSAERDPRREELAVRLVDAERRLAEQERMLAAMRVEIQSREAAVLDAGGQISRLQSQLDRQCSAIEALRQRESLVERGKHELDTLSRMLDEESRRIATERERCREADQRAAAQAADYEQKCQSLDSAWRELESVRLGLEADRRSLAAEREELSSSINSVSQQRSAVDSLTADLSERDYALSQSEESLKADREAVEHRAAALAAREADLNRLAQSLAEDSLAAEQQRTLHEEQRISLAGEQEHIRQLHLQFQAQELELSRQRAALEEQQSALHGQQQSLLAQEQALSEQRRAIEQSAASLSAREAEIRQRIAGIEDREQKLHEAETSLADEKQRHEDSRRQQLNELADALAQLNADRQQLAADREGRDRELRQAEDSLKQSAEQAAVVRQQDEAEVSEIRKQLAKRGHDLDAREEELTRLRDECQLRAAELDARAALLETQILTKPADDAPSPVCQTSTEMQELDAWRDRLAFIEQELNARAQQIEEAEQRLELERQSTGGEADRADIWSAGRIDNETIASNEPPLAGQGPALAIDPAPGDSAHDVASRATQQEVLTLDDAANPSHQAQEPSFEPVDQDEADVQTLRHQLAEMFGIQAAETSIESRSTQPSVETEPLEDGQVVSDAETTSIEEPASAHVTPAVHDETHHHDTVESYWQKLLARNRGDLQYDATPKQSEHVDPKPTAKSSEPAERPRHESPAQSPVSITTHPDASRRSTSLDHEERSALRAHMSSLRAVANHSARSAVAKHVTKQMTIQYHVKGLITLISGVVCIVMLTSPFWSNVAYVDLGLAAFFITGIMGTLLWFDYRKLQAAAESALGGKTEAPDVNEEAPAVEEPPAAQEPESIASSTDETPQEISGEPSPEKGKYSSMLTGLLGKRTKA